MYGDAVERTLDDRAGVRQRRRLRADHARPGHPHGRARRLRGGRARPARSRPPRSRSRRASRWSCSARRYFERLRAQHATRAPSSTAPGPAAAGAILGAAVPLAAARSTTTWQWVVLAARRDRAARAGPRRSGCSSCGGLVGPRHYALAMDLQDETAEVLSQADPVPHRQPARQRARVPGVARGLSGGRRARGRARRRRAGAPEPGRARCAAATARRSATSRTSTPCSPTPRTGAPTRGAPSCATASCTAAARST